MFADTDLLAELPTLRRISARWDNAEDVIQETCRRALKGRDKFIGSNFQAWLCTILRNTRIDLAADYSRACPGSRSDHRVAEPRVARAYEPIEDNEPTTPANQEHAVAVTDMIRLLATLRAPDRDALLALRWDGLTQAEAAAALGVPKGTVGSRVHRAEAQLSWLMDR